MSELLIGLALLATYVCYRWAQHSKPDVGRWLVGLTVAAVAWWRLREHRRDVDTYERYVRSAPEERRFEQLRELTAALTSADGEGLSVRRLAERAGMRPLRAGQLLRDLERIGKVERTSPGRYRLSRGDGWRLRDDGMVPF